MYSLYFYVPESHVEQVKAAIFAKGAGRMGCYDCCAWQTLGAGQFRPLIGSQPAIGRLHQLETVAEYKVETVCQETDLHAVVQALIDSHPYEMPAYGLNKISTVTDLFATQPQG